MQGLKELNNHSRQEFLHHYTTYIVNFVETDGQRHSVQALYFYGVLIKYFSV